jgi:hypothetical protein
VTYDNDMSVRARESGVILLEYTVERMPPSTRYSCRIVYVRYRIIRVNLVTRNTHISYFGKQAVPIF